MLKRRSSKWIRKISIGQSRGSFRNRLGDRKLVSEQKAIVILDTPLDYGVFENVLGMCGVFLNNNDEWADRLHLDEVITMVGQKRTELRKLIGRDLKPILSGIIEWLQPVKHLLTLKVMLEQVCLIDLEDMNLPFGWPT